MTDIALLVGVDKGRRAGMKELKPCPFCGWGTIVDGGGFFSHACECNACHAKTKNYKTWEEAIEAWNRRAGAEYD